MRVILTERAVERVGIQTASVLEEASGAAMREVVPYGAILYDKKGHTWTFTNPQPRVFVRQQVSVERIDGDRVYLTEGPPAGTAVVTVGAAELILFSDAVESACGMAGSAVGPFYCPPDRRVYIDLAFYRDLDRRFGAPGDFAQAYVIAHEVGHHVQNLLGVADQAKAAEVVKPRSYLSGLDHFWPAIPEVRNPAAFGIEPRFSHPSLTLR